MVQAMGIVDDVERLARDHADLGPLTRTAFFDYFELDTATPRDGYRARDLYDMYLKVRARQRVINEEDRLRQLDEVDYFAEPPGHDDGRDIASA
jgi:hypothetical protein